MTFSHAPCTTLIKQAALNSVMGLPKANMGTPAPKSEPTAEQTRFLAHASRGDGAAALSKLLNGKTNPLMSKNPAVRMGMGGILAKGVHAAKQREFKNGPDPMVPYRAGAK